MREPIILKAMQGYADSNSARFHMPGHKGNAEFEKLFPMASGDITELSFSGCLFSDEGIIATAQKNVAEILGARASHFVTDGSTSAILAMLYSLSKRGKKVIIPRFSHKSVYNAIKLFGLEPIFLPIEEKDGIIYQRADGIDEMLSSDGGIAGVMLISPDYYGLSPDLATASVACKKHGKILLVDGAHGGHLKFVDNGLYAGNYADAWVDGAHKTLPCLTQAAILNVANDNISADIEDGLSIFRTTSPSYPIMASIEYGVYYGEHLGQSGFNKFFDRVEKLKQSVKAVGGVFAHTDDCAKVVFDCALSGVGCSNLNAHLEECGIYPEFSDGRYIVFMASPMNTEDDFERLAVAVEDFLSKNKKSAQNTQKPSITDIKTYRKTDYVTAATAPWTLVDEMGAVGRIAAENIGFFPPCYPVVTAGEVITRQAAEAIGRAKNSFGLINGLFKVVKE